MAPEDRGPSPIRRSDEIKRMPITRYWGSLFNIPSRYRDANTSLLRNSPQLWLYSTASMSKLVNRYPRHVLLRSLNTARSAQRGQGSETVNVLLWMWRQRVHLAALHSQESADSRLSRRNGHDSRVRQKLHAAIATTVMLPRMISSIPTSNFAFRTTSS